jgi:multidrug efflux pump subunit AcrA (membrane-fusion protein)
MQVQTEVRFEFAELRHRVWCMGTLFAAATGHDDRRAVARFRPQFASRNGGVESRCSRDGLCRRAQGRLGTASRADAQHSGTRTLLAEIDLPNPDGVLRSGVYCTVELMIPRRTPSFVLPADAIIFNSNGVQVVVVKGGKADFRKVRVTRDFGTRLEVDTGIKAGDQVILNPPVNLVDGSRIQIRRTEPVATN